MGRPEVYPAKSAFARTIRHRPFLSLLPPTPAARYNTASVPDGEVGDWRRFLSMEDNHTMSEALRRHARAGRPLGDAAFIAALENRLDRALRCGKPRRKPKRTAI
jgi:hypothetical protein